MTTDIDDELEALRARQERHARWVTAFRAARDDGMTLDEAVKAADKEVDQ